MWDAENKLVKTQKYSAPLQWLTWNAALSFDQLLYIVLLGVLTFDDLAKRNEDCSCRPLSDIPTFHVSWFVTFRMTTWIRQQRRQFFMSWLRLDWQAKFKLTELFIIDKTTMVCNSSSFSSVLVLIVVVDASVLSWFTIVVTMSWSFTESTFDSQLFCSPQ